eukprot:CAMPEP_0198208716 /NCGR_PEP_ID=MMETSP1445-20131203/12065_1 /TAXON_ID=36898 /ORGANISM="Pyramimonas sp., Strain CCMP2087" /LENGTH=153 /DNA_ID=CAMNT_0043882229 /DNA_START=245 /DNA_END=709 /DNA_ORIENTATION=-
MSHFTGVDVHHVRGQKHLTQWYKTGDRTREQAASEDPNSPQRTYLQHYTSDTPKALAEYRKLIQLTKDPAEAARKTNNDPIFDLSTPKVALQLPSHQQHAPHQVHHHHFGWGGPQVDYVVGADASRDAYRKKGHAMQYCQNIGPKSALMSTKR